jgi:hypothetical protein
VQKHATTETFPPTSDISWKAALTIPPNHRCLTELDILHLDEFAVALTSTTASSNPSALSGWPTVVGTIHPAPASEHDQIYSKHETLTIIKMLMLSLSNS